MSNPSEDQARGQDHDLDLGVSKRRRLWHEGIDSDRTDGHCTPPLATLSHEHYTVGWVCALPLEMAAAEGMLDEIHPPLRRNPIDNNTYTLGRIGEHNVVIACLPAGIYGTTSATVVASQMLSSFRSVNYWLMVGIGGGVPSARADIRLGDIVVSVPTLKSDGVLQYDYGKTLNEGRFERTGTLNKPPPTLLTAVSKLQARHRSHGSEVPALVSEMLRRRPQMSAGYSYPGQHNDNLYRSEYDHPELEATCELCDKTRLVPRPPREDDEPIIHLGLVASGNQVMKHGRTRDRLAKEIGGILCFEMEAAGLMDNFPCLVIRGISDYADSHKNNAWQGYASATAAAYAKELLSVIAPTEAAAPPALVAKLDTTKHRKALMDALCFKQIDSRQTTIKTAHHKTCEWLLQKSEYQDWLDVDKIPEHHGFLWVKGKAGSGKSTIMKFAVKHTLEHNRRRPDGDSYIISFFFNARGEILERSTNGMYRSLLYQLLGNFPELQSVLDSLNFPSCVQGSDLTLNIVTLQGLLFDAVGKLEGRRLICFIDALDECEEDQVRDMIEFFGSLGQKSVSAGIRLHTCFSSRHYPHISIRNGLELILETQEGHTQDMADYIHSELNLGNSPQAEQIRTEVLRKASGIFLWVFLVVPILNKEYDRGRVHGLRKKLQQIPTKLGDLFKNILTRDNENMDGLLLCIQWVLYARRPLTREELYFAILTAEDPDSLSPWNPDEVTVHDMERLILDSSKGLVEVTKSGTPTVQFIHESVRDYLKENGLRDLWPELKDNITGASHERLKRCCQSVLKAELLPATSLEDAELSKYPFVEYAVHNVFFHANAAGGDGVCQAIFLENFPLKEWLNLQNRIERFQTRRYSRSASRLYIFSDQNLAHLIKLELDSNPGCIDRFVGERHQYPIMAALVNVHRDALRALLTPDSGHRLPDPLSEYSREPTDEDLNQLVNAKRDLTQHKNRPLLANAIKSHNVGIVRLLLFSGRVENSIQLIGKQTLLLFAAYWGDEAIAKWLLGTGVNCTVMGGSKYLLDMFSGFMGWTPLTLAVERGHEGVAKLFLQETDLDFSFRNWWGDSALDIAVQGGFERIVTLLLTRKEIDVNSRDKQGTTVLTLAAQHGNEEIIKVLLTAARIDVNSRNDDGWTPLLVAAFERHIAIVKLLLAHPGIDVNLKGQKGWTALMTAVFKKEKPIVKMLLAKEEICINAQNHAGRTALLIAVHAGNDSMMKLLLAHPEIDVNAKCPNGLTALITAAANGQDAAVNLLLAQPGIKLNLKSNKGWTALMSAASIGHESTVKLLLAAEGIDIHAKTWGGLTAQSMATSQGHTTIAALLDSNSSSQSQLTPADEGYDSVIVPLSGP